MKSFTRKAETSIIFLMVEIAIILSAAVFVSLLIGKTTGFTGRVTDDGSLALEQGSPLSITQIIAKDGRDGDLESIIIRAEAIDNIDLNDAVIVIKAGNVSATLKYRNGTLEPDIESGFYTK
ncbi:MAG: hypothetical protein QXK37_02910 [Candidatus Woesearchaeota archaeon]